MDNRSKTPGEEFHERAGSKPDRWTLAWWKHQWEEVRRGYAGANHGINLCRAEYADCWKAVEELRARCDGLEKGMAESDAEIGRLRESLEKAREAYAALKKLP